MSDDENSDFLADPKAYEDDHSEILSGLSRKGSESITHPSEDFPSRKQDSTLKNSSNMVADLREKLRRNVSETSEPSHLTSQEIPLPKPPSGNRPSGPIVSKNHEVPDQSKNTFDICLQLKAIYPQRYFIFKNIPSNQLKLAREHNYAMAQKMNENTLKSAFENSEDLFIIFSSTNQRAFLGYARMQSNYFDSPELIDSLSKSTGIKREEFDNNFVFNIEWKSKNVLNYQFVSHIKNKYNDNKEVNHSKAFQEVDPASGSSLIELIENPPKEPVMEPEPEHKTQEAPMPVTSKPLPYPNNFMMNNPNPMMHHGYPFYPPNYMGGPMGGMNHMGNMFPMMNQPGVMPGRYPPFNMPFNNNDYMMPVGGPKQGKGRKKSASSSRSASGSSSGSSSSSSPKKSSKGKKESKSPSRSVSTTQKKRDNRKAREREDNYRQDRNRYDNKRKFQKFDRNYRGKRRDSPVRNDRKRNNYHSSKSRRRSASRSEERRRRNSPERQRKNDNNNGNAPKQETGHEPRSPNNEREQSLSVPHEDDFLLEFDNMDEKMSDNGHRKDEEDKGNRDEETQRQNEEAARELENLKRGYGQKPRSGSKSKGRSQSRSNSKSVTEAKSSTRDNDRGYHDRKKRRYRHEDKPLVITKGNKEDKIIIGGKDNVSRLIIDKSTARKQSRRESRERERRKSSERNGYRKSREREKNETRDSKPAAVKEKEVERREESSENKAAKVRDLRQSLSEKKAQMSGSITSRIIKKN